MTLTYITIGAFVIVLGVLIISPKFRKQNYLEAIKYYNQALGILDLFNHFKSSQKLRIACIQIRLLVKNA